jgi:NAD(P)H-dependent FMN reductase
MSVISVVVGSTRQGRFSERVAPWVLNHLKQREGVDARLLDLRDYEMPFFDQPLTPSMAGRPAYEHEAVQRWTQKIAESDGFILVTAEYNFGPAAVLKNALDWVYPEWNRKACAFVGHGAQGGVRAVQQLREIVSELQMMPVRRAVHLPLQTLMAHFQGGDVDKELTNSDAAAGLMLDDLLWWTEALTVARAKG